MKPSRIVRTALSILGIGVLGCSSGNDSNNTRPLDPTLFQNYLDRNFSNVTILTSGLARLVDAVSGNPQPGVTFTETSTGITGVVAADVDGNGTLESNVHAQITYANPSLGIVGGGTLDVTEINAPGVSGTLHAQFNVTGGGTSVTFSNGSATYLSSYGPDVIISDAQLTVTPTVANALVLGSAEFSAGSASGTIFFEDNGSGSWRMRVVTANFGFTVP